MIKIEFTANFIKNYNKRFAGQTKIKQRFEERTRLFSQNSNSPILKDHSLIGEKRGYRAFSITGDIRVVYRIIDSVVYFYDIGTHNQVY